MGAIKAMISVVMIPLALVNMLGGIVSGIWLAVLGEWGSIGIGILALFISGLTVSVLLIPGVLLALPGAFFAEKGWTPLFWLFALFGNVYTVALIAVWCLAIMWYFAGRADQDSFIPMMIWSYGVALGPWMWLAQKEQQSGSGGGEMISLFFAQLAYLTAILYAFFAHATVLDIVYLFGGFMLLALFVQFGVAIAVTREHKF